jgi:hypothetical protein
MGNENKILIIALVIVLIIIPVGYWLAPEPVDNEVRVGDVWEYYAVGDPSILVHTRRVIGVKNNYIQFIQDDRDTLSQIKIEFKHDSEKISSNTIKKDPN